jgi:hypothetical protein
MLHESMSGDCEDGRAAGQSSPGSAAPVVRQRTPDRSYATGTELVSFSVRWDKGTPPVSRARRHNGCAPVHRPGWGIGGEIDLVAAPSAWQDPVHFAITSMASGPDLPKYEFHPRGPCRLPVTDHVRARTDLNQSESPEKSSRRRQDFLIRRLGPMTPD